MFITCVYMRILYEYADCENGDVTSRHFGEYSIDYDLL